MHRINLIALAVLFAAVCGAGLGMSQTGSLQEAAKGRAVRIAVCQTFCIDSDIEGNLKRIEYAVEDAARQRAEIACFPETALIGWVNPKAHELATPIPGALSDRIASLAKKHEIMIAIGLCEKDGDALHDSVILVGTDGEILLKHRKINTLDELMDPPYTSGSVEDVAAVDTPIGRVGMLICADTFKDEYIDAAAAKKPELMIIPYGWAAGVSQWPQHAKQLEAVVKHAAKRIGCPVVGTDLVGVISSGPWKGLTYGGQSIVIDSAGKVLGILRDRDAEVKVVDVPIGPSSKRSEAKQPIPVAFVNVNVIPMDRERVISDQTVIVEKDRISSIGSASSTRIPDRAMRIDGRGRYLMPGLADMHVHIMEEDQLLLFIANGVTTVRNMAGEPEHLAWRERIRRGELLGPTIYTAGPIIDGDPPVWPESVVITDPERTSEIVAGQKEAGYDFLKVYSSLSKPVYDALIQAAREEGIPVAGHVPTKVGLEHVLAARQRCIEHLDGYEKALASEDCVSVGESGLASVILPWLDLDTDKIPDIVGKTREAATWNCPTLIVLQKWLPSDEANLLLQRDEFRYLSPTEMDFHRPGGNYLKGFTTELYEAAAGGDGARKKLTKALHDAGARILLGTDCPNPLIAPGFSVHEELQNFVDAGLTPYQAIRAGTRDAAEFLGGLEEFGTVAVGRRADLLLVEGNPLHDVANVNRRIGVMVRGRWLPEGELQERLETLARKYAEKSGNLKDEG